MTASSGDRTERQRRVWDKAAPHYDQQIAWWERVWFGEDLRPWVGQRASGRTLEIAVGTGRSLPFYAPDVQLTAIDLSEEMVALTRQRAAALGRDLTLGVGDAEDLAFADHSFDTVVCVLGLCSIPDPVRAIAEMKRVLVPGGSLLLVDHVRSTFLPLLAAQKLVEQFTGRLAGEYFTRRQRPVVEAAGFTVVEERRTALGTVESLLARSPGQGGVS